MGNLWTHVISFRRHPISYKDDLKRSLQQKATGKTRTTAVTLLSQQALYNVEDKDLPRSGSYGQLYRITSRTNRNEQSFIFYWAIFEKSSKRRLINTKIATSNKSSIGYIDKLCTAYAIPKNGEPMKQLANDIGQTISSSRDAILVRVDISGGSVVPRVPTRHIVISVSDGSQPMRSNIDTSQKSPASRSHKAPKANVVVKTTIVSNNGVATKQFSHPRQRCHITHPAQCMSQICGLRYRNQ